MGKCACGACALSKRAKGRAGQRILCCCPCCFPCCCPTPAPSVPHLSSVPLLIHGAGPAVDLAIPAERAPGHAAKRAATLTGADRRISDWPWPSNPAKGPLGAQGKQQPGESGPLLLPPLGPCHRPVPPRPSSCCRPLWCASSPEPVAGAPHDSGHYELGQAGVASHHVEGTCRENGEMGQQGWVR